MHLFDVKLVTGGGTATYKRVWMFIRRIAMRLICKSLAVALAGWSITPAAHAEPLSGATLPKDTLWVIHADVDAARLATPLWNIINERVDPARRAELQTRMASIENMTGMEAARGDDLHDVTVFGAGFDDASACIRIHGQMDAAAITRLLKANPAYTERKYRDFTILSWHDATRDRTFQGCFAAADVAILSPDAKILEAALDILDKTAPAAAGDSAALYFQRPPRRQGHKPPSSGSPEAELASLHLTEKAQSPMLTQCGCHPHGRSVGR